MGKVGWTIFFIFLFCGTKFKVSCSRFARGFSILTMMFPYPFTNEMNGSCLSISEIYESPLSPNNKRIRKPDDTQIRKYSQQNYASSWICGSKYPHPSIVGPVHTLKANCSLSQPQLYAVPT